MKNGKQKKQIKAETLKGVRKDRPSKDMEHGRNLKLINKEKEKQTKQATGKASTKPATSISV